MHYLSVVLAFTLAVCSYCDLNGCVQDGGTLLVDNVCIPKSYKKHRNPDTKTIVNFRFTLTATRDIDETAMSVTNDIVLEAIWVDPRLVSITGENQNQSFEEFDFDRLNEIWKPDTYIMNLIKFEESKTIGDASSLYLSYGNSNVTVRTISKNEITIACNMDFASFPFDIQTCPVKLASLLPVTEVEFVGEVYFDMSEHIVSEFDFEATPYFENFTYDYFGQELTVNVIGYELTLKRNSVSYLFSYYFPVTGMVLLASVSFLVPPDAVPGRIALLVTLLLTMISLFGSIQDKIPRTNKLTAVGIFIITSVFFIFFALSEYALLLLIKRRRVMLKNKAKLEIVKNHEKDKTNAWRDINEQMESIKCEFRDSVVDQYAFIFYCCSVTLFIIIYWIIYS